MAGIQIIRAGVDVQRHFTKLLVNLFQGGGVYKLQRFGGGRHSPIGLPT